MGLALFACNSTTGRSMLDRSKLTRNASHISYAYICAPSTGGNSNLPSGGSIVGLKLLSLRFIIFSTLSSWNHCASLPPKLCNQGMEWSLLLSVCLMLYPDARPPETRSEAQSDWSQCPEAGLVAVLQRRALRWCCCCCCCRWSGCCCGVLLQIQCSMIDWKPSASSQSRLRRAR